MHQSEVQTLRAHIQSIVDNERKRPKNDPAVQLWEKLTDSTGNLLGGFLRRWETEGMMKAAFIADKKAQVSTAFDKIMELENAKPKQ